MNITMLGNFTVSYSSESHHARTLEQMGHNVHRIQEGSEGYTIINGCTDADLLVWIHSHSATPSTGIAIPRVLRHIKDRGVTTCTYHLDLYAGIPERFAGYQQHPFMTDLDHFFSVDPKLVDWLNTNGGTTKGHYLTAGVLADECYMANPIGEPFPVIFVGSYHYHKAWPYRPQLIDWLKQTYQEHFTGWGPNFPSGVIRGADLNQLYANSKIVIGDSYSPGFNYPGYWSDRIPETLGRGGFLIHPNIKGIGDFYQDGVHLCLYDFGDFDQLQEYTDYYLNHDVEREAIRRAGHEHVRKYHTFTHRWTQILDLVKQ